MRNRLPVQTLFLCSLFCASTAAASAQVRAETEGQSPPVIQLRPGFAALLRLPSDAGTVTVGNPEVATVVPEGPRALLLTAKANGATNLIVLDPSGGDLYEAIIAVGGPRLTGGVVVHDRRDLNTYWAYRCSSAGCTRVEDKLEGVDPPPPSVVIAPTISGAVDAVPPAGRR
jgi:hypothetical protein